MKGKDMDKRKDLEARFGPDLGDWPPPHAGLVAGGDTGRLHAALTVEGDETALAEAVLTRLARPEPGLLAGLLPVILPPRVALAGYAGLWLALAVLGYQVMGGMLGDPILALALGEAPGWELLQ
jgi:hypothetical protein